MCLHPTTSNRVFRCGSIPHGIQRKSRGCPLETRKPDNNHAYVYGRHRARMERRPFGVEESSCKGYMPATNSTRKNPASRQSRVRTAPTVTQLQNGHERLTCSFGTPWVDHFTDTGCEACDSFTNNPQGWFEWHTPKGLRRKRDVSQAR
jgi:hypothetical protein